MSGRGVVAVAVSGGRDSTALLHATARWARQQADVLVVALHVHHGLMPQADAWWRHLSQQCARWKRAGLPVRFVGHRLASGPQPGDSIEAWARRERYRALAAMARAEEAELVLLAHHRQDQAETVLLQALRGAGPRGLAAMPEAVFREGLWWHRPWLNHSSQAIERYVHQHRLKTVVDDSNADPRFARSRLRVQLWPSLLGAFPDAEQALAASAQRAQESSAVLDEVAELDCAACSDEHGNLLAGRWAALSDPRQGLVLRHWLRVRAGRGIPETLIQRLQREWPAAGSGHRWPAPGGLVHSGRGLLLWQADNTPNVLPETNKRITHVNLSRPGVVDATGWGGRWRVQAVRGVGVDAELMVDLQLRERVGSEQFQLHPRSTPRSLKKQFQALGVAAADRGGPLLFAQDQLVFVPGLGLDARVLNSQVRRRVTIDWLVNSGAG